MFMEDDFSVSYRSWYPKDNQTYYIKAATEFSTFYGYLPFNITITPPVIHVHHTPPFFKSDLASVELTLNKSSLERDYNNEEISSLEIELPEIMDANGDLCTITLSSPTLGFQFWTNTTDLNALAKINRDKRKSSSQGYAWIERIEDKFFIQF